MYYVYELIDPRDGKPFYVGKGTGNRFAAHEKEAVKGKRGLKCDRIREILAAGEKITHRIVRTFRDESKAYAFEEKHISRLGPQTLTNIMAGGVWPAQPTADGIDNATANALLQIAIKTNGFTEKRKWWFGQMWHELPDDFLPAMAAHFWKLVDQRGWQWVTLRTVKINGF